MRSVISHHYTRRTLNLSAKITAQSLSHLLFVKSGKNLFLIGCIRFGKKLVWWITINSVFWKEDPPSSQWMTGLNRVISLAQRRWFSLTWPSYAKVLLTSASRCSWKASVLTAACMPGSGTSWQDAGSAWTEGNYVWLVVSYGLMYFRIAYKCLLGTSCLKVSKVSLPESFGWTNYYVLRINLNLKKKHCSQSETSYNQSVRTGFSLICFDRLHKFWIETGLINNNQFGFLKGRSTVMPLVLPLVRLQGPFSAHYCFWSISMG